MMAERHGFRLDDGLLFVLKPDELTVESVELGLPIRTHIRRYKVGDSVRRIEPVALSPRDFVDEWLKRPWSEMEPLSTPETAAWHSRLYNQNLDAESLRSAQCVSSPGKWVVTLEGRYFLVNDLGGYRYRMESISGSQPEGCPEESESGMRSPWLTAEQLRGLK
jgi:hypothetical protein